METMLPEGLQWQPLEATVALLASPGTFNCIRLTYSVDLFFLGANLTARQSFARLGLTSTIAAVEKFNPELIDLPLLAVRDAVVLACNAANIFVLFDNQVSHSEWCCGTTDGNGWWNDRYFNVSQWLYSLRAISSHYAAIAPNAVAYSLRNELRSDFPRSQQVSDWLTYVPQGLDAVHAGNPNALIFVSGLNYDCDWSFLDAALPANSTAWKDALQRLSANLVFETHIYSWSGFVSNWTDDCAAAFAAFDRDVGYANRLGRPHVLTEIGLDQTVYPRNPPETHYMDCVGQWVMLHKMGWGIWLFGGSYYVRNGRANEPDSFGSTTTNFSTYKNQDFLTQLRKMRWEAELTEDGQRTASEQLREVTE